MSKDQQHERRYSSVAVAVFAVVMVLTSGCETKSKARLQQQTAYMAGQQQAMTQAQAGKTVRITGEVQNSTIPWTETLTLSQAIVDADYRGLRDPRRIVVRRFNQPPITIAPRQLLQGEDMPLQPGDVVQIEN